MSNSVLLCPPTEIEHRRRVQVMHQILVSLGVKDFTYDPELQGFHVPDPVAQQQARIMYDNTAMILDWASLPALIEVLLKCGLMPSREKATLMTIPFNPPYRKVI